MFKTSSQVRNNSLALLHEQQQCASNEVTRSCQLKSLMNSVSYVVRPSSLSHGNESPLENLVS